MKPSLPGGPNPGFDFRWYPSFDRYAWGFPRRPYSPPAEPGFPWKSSGIGIGAEPDRQPADDDGLRPGWWHCICGAFGTDAGSRRLHDCADYLQQRPETAPVGAPPVVDLTRAHVQSVRRLMCRDLRTGLGELRRVATKNGRRTPDEQLTYDRLRRWVIDHPSVDRETIAEILECHERTIRRMTASTTDEENVVDIAIARRLDQIEQTQREILHVVKEQKAAEKTTTTHVADVIDIHRGRRRGRRSEAA